MIRKNFLPKLLGFVMIILFLQPTFITYAETDSSESKIEIADYTAPTGILEVGKFFSIKGKITSDKKLINVEAGVYYRDGSTTTCGASKNPDSTTFELKEIDELIYFDQLKEGFYTYVVRASDETGYEKILVSSDFQVGANAVENKIELKNTNFPPAEVDKGTDFNITCDIVSNQAIEYVLISLCTADTGEEKFGFTATPNTTTYNISTENKNSFNISNLVAGDYTYRVFARDVSGYSTILTLYDFTVKEVASSDSSITISNAEMPSGKLEQGAFFNLRGEISSKYKLTEVYSAISVLNGDVVQEAKFSPNATTFNIYPSVDYSMLFDKLETGRYTYIIDATDEKGYKIRLVSTNFQVGDIAEVKGDANLDGKVDIADAVAVAAYIGNSNNKLDSQGITNGDVHGDGNGLNSSDVLTIQQYLSGIITKF